MGAASLVAVELREIARLVARLRLARGAALRSHARSNLGM